MIGPAEIEDLLAEHASATAATSAPCWPVMCHEPGRSRPARRERPTGASAQAQPRRPRR